MLYIEFINLPTELDKGRQFVFDIDFYFNHTYNPEWLEDKFVQEMILDVDKSRVLGNHCIESPVLGLIPPEKLSGGVKALIIMYKQPEVEVWATNCGDNCAKWILEISKKQDIKILLSHCMNFEDGKESRDVPMEGIITNTGREIHTVYDYNDAWLTFGTHICG